MLYYKVDVEHTVYTKIKREPYTFVEDELVTEKEFERLTGWKVSECRLFNKYSHMVNISKRNIYFMFGIRFENR